MKEMGHNKPNIWKCSCPLKGKHLRKKSLSLKMSSVSHPHQSCVFMKIFLKISLAVPAGITCYLNINV